MLVVKDSLHVNWLCPQGIPVLITPQPHDERTLTAEGQHALEGESHLTAKRDENSKASLLPY